MELLRAIAVRLSGRMRWPLQTHSKKICTFRVGSTSCSTPTALPPHGAKTSGGSSAHIELHCHEALSAMFLELLVIRRARRNFGPSSGGVSIRRGERYPLGVARYPMGNPVDLHPGFFGGSGSTRNSEISKTGKGPNVELAEVRDLAMFHTCSKMN